MRFILFLGLAILLHEGGHFLVCKLANIGVIRFSVFFGPAIVKFDWGETQYCLGCIPFGGYVFPSSQRSVPPDGIGVHILWAASC
jgi:regulator of sigma E protease